MSRYTSHPSGSGGLTPDNGAESGCREDGRVPGLDASPRPEPAAAVVVGAGGTAPAMRSAAAAAATAAAVSLAVQRSDSGTTAVRLESGDPDLERHPKDGAPRRWCGVLCALLVPDASLEDAAGG